MTTSYPQRPEIIRKWCTCRWSNRIQRDESGTPIAIHPTPDVRGCRLHDPDERFDLPESV